MRLRCYSALSVLLLAAALLSACTTAQPVVMDQPGRERLYESKSDQLDGYSDWSLVGRLAVSNSADGGSGHFSWKNIDADSQMDFHGALGRGAWRLLANAQGAELKLADGTVHKADSIDQLVHLQVGWEIPVDSLSWWVRGMAAPGDYEERQIDAEGNLSELLQGGWAIEYGRYRSFEGMSLPVKLTARQADWKVKLAIRDWKLGTEMISND